MWRYDVSIVVATTKCSSDTIQSPYIPEIPCLVCQCQNRNHGPPPRPIQGHHRIQHNPPSFLMLHYSVRLKYIKVNPNADKSSTPMVIPSTYCTAMDMAATRVKGLFFS